MRHIVRLANFVTPTSGGQRTALEALGGGYLAAGYATTLVVPGERASDVETGHGRLITLPGPTVPGLGGYRVLPGRRRLSELLTRLAPDRLEVCDRTTLRWTGRWAAERGIPSIVVCHESLAGLLGVAGLPRSRLADRLNARTAVTFDRVVCTTAWAAREFWRVGATNVVQVPLGVDLVTFDPSRYDRRLRAAYAEPDQLLLVYSGRLSTEKRPGRAVEALAGLRDSGVDAALVVAGDGPLRERLIRKAAGLPVRFIGFVADRDAMAALLATADVAVAPGPIETFGLSALEALACGTPVVVDAASALPEVIADAGVAVTGEDYPAAIRRLISRPTQARREAARRRAERFDWRISVAGFLAAHDLPPVSPRDSLAPAAGPAVVGSALEHRTR